MGGGRGSRSGMGRRVRGRVGMRGGTDVGGGMGARGREGGFGTSCTTSAAVLVRVGGGMRVGRMGARVVELVSGVGVGSGGVGTRGCVRIPRSASTPASRVSWT